MVHKDGGPGDSGNFGYSSSGQTSTTPYATAHGVRAYPASSPYPIVTNLATREPSLPMPMCH